MARSPLYAVATLFLLSAATPSFPCRRPMRIRSDVALLLMTSSQLTSLFFVSQDVFRGITLHSGQYKNASGWKGKHGVVVGTANTGLHTSLY